MQGQSVVAAAVFGAALMALSGQSYAQGADIGKEEYHATCASCHGDDGKGSGPVAGFLKQKVPDLTVLAKDSGGVFPFSRVYEVIDGRAAVAAHGPRDMPVWGSEYTVEVGGHTFGFGSPREIKSLVRGRIIALVGYIYSLQAK